MFIISLIEPEIPPNTGNISRLAAATGSRLELVGKLGFDISDKAVRRAGLDYWKHVDLQRHLDVEEFMDTVDGSKVHLFTTKADKSYIDADFKDGDRLVFGPETRGLDPWILEKFSGRCVTLPMFNPEVRSLNLSNTVAIGLYEALRQTNALSLP